MRTQFKRMLATGNVFIWACAAGVSLSLLMVFGLLLLIMINGLGYFWISDIVELTLKDGQHVMGQLAGREVIPRSITPDRLKGKAVFESRSVIATCPGLISNGSTMIKLCRRPTRPMSSCWSVVNGATCMPGFK